jgi:epoxyqueuosine reductase QueG
MIDLHKYIVLFAQANEADNGSMTIPYSILAGIGTAIAAALAYFGKKYDSTMRKLTKDAEKREQEALKREQDALKREYRTNKKLEEFMKSLLDNKGN